MTAKVDHNILYCPDCKHPAQMHHDLRWGKEHLQGCQGCDCLHSRHDLVKHPEGSLDARILDDGRLATLYPTIFGRKILLGAATDPIGGNEWYDWGTVPAGQEAWREWDGYGQPKAWNRHQFGDGEIELQRHAIGEVSDPDHG